MERCMSTVERSSREGESEREDDKDAEETAPLSGGFDVG